MQSPIESSKVEIEQKSSTGDTSDVSDLSKRLNVVVSNLQIYGLFIVLLTFGSAALCAVAISSAFKAGVTFRDELLWRQAELAQLSSMIAIILAGFAIFLVFFRDSMVRHGRVIADILIEEAERTSVSEMLNTSVSVRVAIRSFQQLKGLPLVGEQSTGVFYLLLSTASLLISIFVAVAVA